MTSLTEAYGRDVAAREAEDEELRLSDEELRLSADPTNVLNDIESLTDEERRYAQAVMDAGATYLSQERLELGLRWEDHGVTPEWTAALSLGQIEEEDLGGGNYRWTVSPEAMDTLGGVVPFRGTEEDSELVLPEGVEAPEYWGAQGDPSDGMQTYRASGSPSGGYVGRVTGAVRRTVQQVSGQVQRTVAQGARYGGRVVRRSVAWGERNVGHVIEAVGPGRVGDFGERMSHTSAEDVGRQIGQVTGVGTTALAALSVVNPFVGLAALSVVNPSVGLAAGSAVLYGDEFSAIVGGAEGERGYYDTIRNVAGRPGAAVGRAFGADWSAEGVTEALLVGQDIAQALLMAAGSVATGGAPVFSTFNTILEGTSASAAGRDVDEDRITNALAISWGTYGAMEGLDAALGVPATPAGVRPQMTPGTAALRTGGQIAIRTGAGMARGQDVGEALAQAAAPAVVGVLPEMEAWQQAAAAGTISAAANINDLLPALRSDDAATRAAVAAMLIGNYVSAYPYGREKPKGKPVSRVAPEQLRMIA